MRHEIFSPVRHRRDGSLYFQKDNSTQSIAAEVVSLILCISLIIFFIAIALLSPYGVAQAQTPGKSNVGSLTIAPLALPLDSQPTAADLVLEVNPLRDQSGVLSRWPISGILTDGFGERHNPFRHKAFEFHSGQDISAPRGTPVVVAEAGVVVFAGWMRGYGQVVIVSHHDNLSTRYGHLSEVDSSVGQLLEPGTVLGRVGSTGRSTGPHLHFEVRLNDQPVDPLSYLPSQVDSEKRPITGHVATQLPG